MRAGRFKMKWGKYETVQQYVDAVQKNQFVAVAAGVVVHQHTRVLMADLHRRGDNMSAADVRAGLQQLAAELAAASKAAAVGPAEIRRVVAELSSGPQGKAAVEGRVAAANAQIAAALCDCAVCTEAATRVGGRSRARATAVAEQQATEVGSSMSAGAAGPQSQSTQPSVAQGDGLMVGSKDRERQRKKRFSSFSFSDQC